MEVAFYDSLSCIGSKSGVIFSNYTFDRSGYALIEIKKYIEKLRNQTNAK